MIERNMKKIFLVVGLLITTAIIFLHCKNNSASELEASVGRGQKVYEQYCLSCHQADGSGVPHLNPSLIKTSYVLGDPATLINVVKQGLSGVEIDGETYSNPMPSFDNVLNEQQIADVLTYIRNNFGNKADVITVEQVKENKTASTK